MDEKLKNTEAHFLHVLERLLWVEGKKIRFVKPKYFLAKVEPAKSQLRVLENCTFCPSFQGADETGDTWFDHVYLLVVNKQPVAAFRIRGDRFFYGATIHGGGNHDWDCRELVYALQNAVERTN